MNFLAHAFLSFGDEEILAGNMISDFVKGAARFSFPPRVQQGIMLHRQIDEYTDSHPASRLAREVFRPHYRLYSAPIIDILYDHFLANDHSHFDEASLASFTRQVYASLERDGSQLPPRFLTVLTYMKAENWLYHYRTKSGIEKSLRGLVRRATFISDSHTAYRLFLEHYEELRNCYTAFFPDVKEFAKRQFVALT